MELLGGLFQALAIFTVLPALVGFAIARPLLSRERRAKATRALKVCAVDTDCPAGYVCKDGICLPA